MVIPATMYGCVCSAHPSFRHESRRKGGGKKRSTARGDAQTGGSKPARASMVGPSRVRGPDIIATDGEYVGMLHASDAPRHSAVDPRAVRMHELQVLREAQGDAVTLGATRSAGVRVEASRLVFSFHFSLL
jgi:hypothetical protein